MKDDLRFREAKPITGGREEWGPTGLEHGARPSEQNYFQGRYAIRHAWTGPIKCSRPQRGVWGGPPDGADNQLVIASKVAFAPRGKLALPMVIKRDLPEIGVRKWRPAPKPTVAPAPPGPMLEKPLPPKATPGKVKAMSFGGGALAALTVWGLLAAVRRRRR
jgi:hypothetical protein